MTARLQDHGGIILCDYGKEICTEMHHTEHFHSDLISITFFSELVYVENYTKKKIEAEFHELI